MKIKKGQRVARDWWEQMARLAEARAPIVEREYEEMLRRIGQRRKRKPKEENEK
jgi:hypothetical protein